MTTTGTAAIAWTTERTYASGSRSSITVSVDASDLPTGDVPCMDYDTFYNLAHRLLADVMEHCDTASFRGAGKIGHEDCFKFNGVAYSLKAAFLPAEATVEDSSLTDSSLMALHDAFASILLRLRALHILQQRVSGGRVHSHYNHAPMA